MFNQTIIQPRIQTQTNKVENRHWQDEIGVFCEMSESMGDENHGFALSNIAQSLK